MNSNLFKSTIKITILVTTFLILKMPLTAQSVSSAAGNYIKSSGYGGDGGNALSLHMLPSGVVNDNSGNIYFINGNAIRKMKLSTNIVSTIAGSTVSGFSGDGGNAITALLSSPSSLAFDATYTNLYIADQGNQRIRKIVISSNVISTIAGTGIAGFSGDGAAANIAQMNNPSGITVDASGNIFISDKSNNRIRKITASTGKISTVAGTGVAGFSGDGAVATAAKMSNPAGIAVDGAGNIYFADRSNNRIRRIANANNFITTIAGNGTSTFSGDGGLASAAGIKSPNNIILDAATPTAYYISDGNNRIRKVTISTGKIATYAGTGVRGFSGDGSAAGNAMISFGFSGGINNCISKDAAGNVYIADGSNRIRKINLANSIISTIGGNNSFSGDGGIATSAQLKNPSSIAVDKEGNQYVADYGNHRIRKIAKSTGIISTYAGNGVAGYSGDSSLAINASLNSPSAIAIDNYGNLIIADQGNSVIRMIDTATRKIYTIAGTGVAGYSGDNGAATAAKLYFPSSIAIDDNNNIFIADQVNYRIRKINGINGVITSIAGTGVSGYSGDNGPATSAKIGTVTGLTYNNGNLYIADQTNNAVRVIDALNNIYAFAGDGTAGYSGDNAIATAAQLTSPSGLATDSLGNIYIADADNNVIRKVTQSTGFISTIAGNGSKGYAGDGGQAMAASFAYPYAIAFATDKQLYIIDRGNNVVRLLTAEVAFPVVISSFTASLMDKHTAKLNWTTKQEMNSNRFLVQRSNDGQHFETIGMIKAAGNTNASSNYSFTDLNVGSLKTPIVYYRLQQIDNDGKLQFSEVRSLVLKNNRISMTIFPNPASDYIYVNGENISLIQLYDMTGRQIKQFNAQSTNRINLNTINEGVYVIVATNKDGTKESASIVVRHR